MEDNTTEMETTALTTSESATPNNIDLPQLENEIKYHINQLKQNYINIGNNIIELGKRLILAKSIVKRTKRGKWQSWLKNNFPLDYTTATKFIKIAERFQNLATSQPLNQSQMVALLSLPNTEETEKFIEQKESEGNPVSKMPIKTLYQEIKQWKSETYMLTTSQSTEIEDTVTIDITPDDSQQKHDDTEQITSNEPDDTSLDNPVSEEQIYSEPQQPSLDPQQPIHESAHELNNQESPILEVTAEITETSLIEKLSSMSSSLIQQENHKEILQSFAKNNPAQLATTIQNLSTIISELQALYKNE